MFSIHTKKIPKHGKLFLEGCLIFVCLFCSPSLAAGWKKYRTKRKASILVHPNCLYSVVLLLCWTCVCVNTTKENRGKRWRELSDETLVNRQTDGRTAGRQTQAACSSTTAVLYFQTLKGYSLPLSPPCPQYFLSPSDPCLLNWRDPWRESVYVPVKVRQSTRHARQLGWNVKPCIMLYVECYRALEMTPSIFSSVRMGKVEAGF